MGLMALIASLKLGAPLRDPDGFLGPSWVRLPLMVLGAFLVDVIPRSLWRSRTDWRAFKGHALGIIREHWTRERILLVVIGLTSFFITYVSYRNLKNFLPRLGGELQDPVLHRIDQVLAFGHEPAVLLHGLLGEGVAAHVLAFVYLFFLPLSPASLVVWLVWSRNISYGYWYATAHCLAWAFGTASYYLVPSLGPNFAYVWLYSDLDQTGVKSLQDALYNGRIDIIYNPFADSIQSVAGFASLHVGIILTLALITQYTVRHAWIRLAMWVLFALTVVSTLYFGWHYIADDIAGAAIAGLSVWIGGLATGQKFDRGGRASHPTTSTARVPVTEDVRPR
ncbi:phosphatase PAP2 family protein [Nocardioides mesophilus]|uniref:Phosphatase PAP2 family protein n=2 Tax=Nocardioides mesophilus TaxID=433659 RepID=A0A7G9RHA8_9ACTN|nr:phosphatase PAP2 family protein [Nocardioides mesophilus]